MIQLLALDLDDTLLRHDLSLSRGNVAAIKAAEARGVRVVLASGRSYLGMKAFFSMLGTDARREFAICFNGSSIRHSDTGEEIWGKRMDRTLLGEAWDACAHFGVPIEGYLAGENLISFSNEYTDIDVRLSGVPNRVVTRDEFVKHDFIKFVIPQVPEMMNELSRALAAQFEGRAQTFTSKPYFFEMLPLGADKGSALATLASMLGIARESVMAMGDAHNDASMLRWAGVSVAMANALPKIQAMARYKTVRDNEADGVAEAIERFILAPG